MRHQRLGYIAALTASCVAIGLSGGIAPARAERNDPCATAKAQFTALMNRAAFWIGMADILAMGGNQADANRATDEANRLMALADGALNDRAAAC